MNKFSETLERMIKERGITYYRLSKETGVPKVTILNYTTNPKHIKIDHLISLAKFFDVSVDRLLKDAPPIEAQKLEVIHSLKMQQIENLTRN